MLPQFTKEEFKFVGLYVLLLLDNRRFEFADGKGLVLLGASSKTQVKEKQSLLELKEIIESSYTDGITAIPEASTDGSGDIAGVFEDKVSSKTATSGIWGTGKSPLMKSKIIKETKAQNTISMALVSNACMVNPIAGGLWRFRQ